jgi:hypothetical protein
MSKDSACDIVASLNGVSLPMSFLQQLINNPNEFLLLLKHYHLAVFQINYGGFAEKLTVRIL